LSGLDPFEGPFLYAFLIFKNSVFVSMIVNEFKFVYLLRFSILHNRLLLLSRIPSRRCVANRGRRVWRGSHFGQLFTMETPVKAAVCSGEPANGSPISGMGCCTAASGQAAAALPRSATKFAVPLQYCPSRTKPTKGASQQNWSPNGRNGSFTADMAGAGKHLTSGMVRKLTW
jgi:hypothetical protein